LSSDDNIKEYKKELTQSLAFVNQSVPIIVQAQRNGYSSRERIERTTILPQKRAYLCCHPKSLQGSEIDKKKKKKTF
jgi:predicted ferric reductase